MEMALETNTTDHSPVNDMGRSGQQISTLKRRELQAPLIVELIRGFAAEIGYEKAMQIAGRAVEQDAIRSGKMMAEKYGGNGLQELVCVLIEGWAEDDALEFTILEQTGQLLSFDVTRCRYAELYEKLGVKEFGSCLSCARDPAFIKAFNPRMNLIRTRTIMQGDSICDFRINME
jgi:hypothetical protein